MKYLVWVGGVLDYEGTSLNEANSISTEWVAKGYTDCNIETIEESQ